MYAPILALSIQNMYVSLLFIFDFSQSLKRQFKGEKNDFIFKCLLNNHPALLDR